MQKVNHLSLITNMMQSILKRATVRKYKQEDVAPELLNELLSAAMRK